MTHHHERSLFDAFSDFIRRRMTNIVQMVHMYFVIYVLHVCTNLWVYSMSYICTSGTKEYNRYIYIRYVTGQICLWVPYVNVGANIWYLSVR